MFEQLVVDFLQQLEQADAEAHKSQLAFAVGKFEEHYKRKAEETAKRLEDEYEQSNTAGGNSGESSGDDTRAESSGSGGGIGGSPTDAARSRTTDS